MAALAPLGIDVADLDAAGGGARPDSASTEDHVARLVRRATARTLLARAGAGRPRVRSISAPRFIGKCSPVHFFWGSFDLAVTRFSGRRAPERSGRRRDHARGLLARSQQSPASGPAAARRDAASTPTPRRRRGFKEAQSNRPRPLRRELSIFLLAHEAVRNAPDLEAALLVSSRRPMRPRQTPAIGTATHWNGRSADVSSASDVAPPDGGFWDSNAVRSITHETPHGRDAAADAGGDARTTSASRSGCSRSRRLPPSPTPPPAPR